MSWQQEANDRGCYEQDEGGAAEFDAMAEKIASRLKGELASRGDAQTILDAIHDVYWQGYRDCQTLGAGILANGLRAMLRRLNA